MEWINGLTLWIVAIVVVVVILAARELGRALRK